MTDGAHDLEVSTARAAALIEVNHMLEGLRRSVLHSIGEGEYKDGVLSALAAVSAGLRHILDKAGAS